MVNVGDSSHNNWLENVSFNKKAENKDKSNEIGKAIQAEPSNFMHQDSIWIGPNNGIPSTQQIFEIYPDPKGIVDDIRNSPDQNTKNKGLIEFQSKIDSMSSSDVKITRDYIISIMESPTNKDDDMLFLLLKTVNKRLDNEHFNIKPHLIPINKFPTDIVGPKIMFD